MTTPPLPVIQMVERMEVGGLEQVIATLCRRLDRHRFAPELWCLAGGGPLAEQLRAEGVGVRILGVTNYHRPGALLALGRQLAVAKPAILHTHGYFAGVAGRGAGVLARVPAVIHHMHSTYHNFRRRHRLMERLLATGTHTIFCCSQAVADFTQKRLGIDGQKTRVLYNGIDQPPPLEPAKARAVLEQWGIPCDAPLVVTVASLTQHKGHGDLLAAAATVLRQIPACRFLLLGDGPLRPQLERQCRQLAIDHAVFFAGIRHDVRSLLPLAHCLVLPSRKREGLGIALIEAMAAGIPVIGTRLGGIPEVIDHGRTGLLVEPGDADGLGRAIRTLLGDAELRHRLAGRGRQRYRTTFSAATMLAAVEETYDRAIR